MKKILITVKKPEPPERGSANDNPSYWNGWHKFLDEIGNPKYQSQSMKGCSKLTEGCWLLTSPDGLPILSSVILAADSAGFEYSVFFLPEDCMWKKEVKSA